MRALRVALGLSLALGGCVEPTPTTRRLVEIPGLRADPDTGDAACLGAPAGPLGAPIDLEPAEPWRALGWAAVHVDGAGTADAEVDGPFELFDAAGRPADGLRVPGVLRVRATGGGDGRLTLRQPGCDPLTVSLRARPMLGLSAGPLAYGPVGRHVDAFFDGDGLHALVDPAWHPELVGRTAWAFVVADRDRDDWLADPTLTDARGGPWPVAIGSTAALHPLGRPIVARPGELVRYDLVLDVDGDGRLGPGDLIDGLDGPGFTEVPDLAAPGPRPVASVDHPATAPTRRVFFPADLPAGGPEPLVVFSHGIGHTWQMYDHLGAHLASWGYVVLVHENNVGPGPNTAAVSTLAAADALLSDPGAVHPDLIDRVDARRIALIGHSRGGEGVFRALASLASGAGPSAFGLDDVRLVSGVAPTVLRGTSDLVDAPVPLHLLVGSADGDVTGGVFQPQSLGDCAACQWFRLLQRGAGPQVVAYVHGATHNAFTCDGPGCGVDDGASVGGPKLTRPEVHAFMQAHYTAVLGHFVRGDAALGELLRRAGDDVPWPLPDGFPVAVQLRPAPADVRVIDDFQAEPAPDRSSRGDSVRGDVDALIEGPLDDANTTLTWMPTDPMNGMTWSHGDDPRFAARGAVFEWGAPARLEFEVPAGERDLTAVRALSLRIAQATRHPRTLALDDRLELAIGLVDRAGREVTLPTAPYTRVTAPYPRTGDGAGTGWINEFNTIRIAIPDFASVDPAIDLTHVQAVRLRFGAPWGSPEGRVGLDDLLFEAR